MFVADFLYLFRCELQIPQSSLCRRFQIPYEVEGFRGRQVSWWQYLTVISSCGAKIHGPVKGIGRVSVRARLGYREATLVRTLSERNDLTACNRAMFKSSDLGIIAMALEEEDEERRKQRPVKRRKWVENAWKRRTIEGEFYTLMPHLIDNETKFYEYFRMSLITFHKLLLKVEAHLQKEDTFWRQAITPKHRLAVCLR
ncbi:hypothetical protein J6590_031947 [Homalodisca vitripennis]|nr:hypothetical protein J6590_031947 [Homalodisca vitripennis]